MQGYLLDPKVNDLGQKIGFSALSDRGLSKSIFIDQIRKLSSYASQREIKILIENNVITQKLKSFWCESLTYGRSFGVIRNCRRNRR